MLILTSQAQDSLIVVGGEKKICPLQHETECEEQFNHINQSIDSITFYLDGILNSLHLDSLQRY
jgi:hypothetical protein